MDKLKGKGKEATGKVTGDRRKEAEGKSDQAKAKAEGALGASRRPCQGREGLPHRRRQGLGVAPHRRSAALRILGSRWAPGSFRRCRGVPGVARCRGDAVGAGPGAAAAV